MEGRPSFSSYGLFVDIESVPGGEVFALGSTFGPSFRREANGTREVEALLRELRDVGASAEFIAGHNIIAHDLPTLDASFGLGSWRKLPAIDTLYLSPLAFPRNPYHRLVKDERLVPSAKNHPVRDCDASKVVLEDAIASFTSAIEVVPGRGRLALMRWLLARAELPWGGSLGFDLLFSDLGVLPLNDREAAEAWRNQTAGFTCPSAANAEWEKAYQQSTHSAALAYVLAWLPVAGADSVIPAWVRHRFPQTASAIKRLRSTPCDNPRCPWCSETQSPTKQLKRFFGFPSFRAQPALAGHVGKSLQEEIVRLAMGGKSILAILPTGGGKSLCFQVPALHRYFTSGSLTIVITPLQALMKDQVEGLAEKTSITCAAALNGMQTPPEKAAVREAVRLGSIGILYVSPEQLRNTSFKKMILQREIGCWVFDEAHCLSQWGHDFRPDYIYISRFVREIAAEQQVPTPAIMCVTATAKEEVKAEIVAHFRDELGLELVLLDGGTERQNLSYRIEKVAEHEKSVRIQSLLSEKIGDGVGAAVIFTATRKRAQELADFLAAPQRGWACAAFHAGLPAEDKKLVLDNYLAGQLQVVVATNAFGMGIDKPNIRLVVHADTPGSLENYLQEAGRAGRDESPAECVLLFNPEDLETQFGLLSLSKIEKRDIDQIWRAILRADHSDGGSITLSVSEILDGSVEPVSFVEEGNEQRTTKVRTALAVLEKQGFLERDENQTRIFQARLLVANEDEARRKIERLDLSHAKASLWLDVVNLLLSQDENGILSLDDFAELPRMQELYAQLKDSTYARVSPYTPVLQVLNEMARPEVGLISKDLLFSARVRVGKSGPAKRLLRAVSSREQDLVEALRDEDPNPDGWVPLSIRRVNQHLISKGHKSLPKDVLRALRTLSSDGRKMGRSASLIELGYGQRDHVPVRTSASWSEIMELSTLRIAAAGTLLDLLVSKAKTTATGESTVVLVEFGEREVLDAFRSDLTLNLESVRDLPSFIQYILVYLHDNDIIELKNGKALISQSMSLRVLEKRKGKQWRRFTKGDYAGLLVHYSEKVFQIHVMGEYARVGIERLGAHLKLISAYFELGKAAFAARFLREKKEVYERATGIDSFRAIVEELHNPVQQAIVAEPANANMLVLAGPGSGKTRVVAHRCAFLLRVERVRPERILVACFNRHAALQLRKQIYDLVGKDAYGVLVQTYHGLALRLLGRSLGGATNDETPPDFGRILEDATALLAGEQVSDGVREEEERDRILTGFSHILVDEYQDVDAREYAFISAVAGRRESDEDHKLAIMAVGDDDQSIYGFKGANVDFIRRFQEDYQARDHYLTENYRSTKAIIASANQLIARNTDRMKVAHPIRINHKRAQDTLGGRWEELDRVVQGRVQRAFVTDGPHQAKFIADEIKRLSTLDRESKIGGFAVLGRTKEELSAIRSTLEARNIPVDWRADDQVDVTLSRIREIRQWLDYLEISKHETWTADTAKDRLQKLRGDTPLNRWWRFLNEVRAEWTAETGVAEVPVSLIREFFLDAVTERQRANRTSEGVVLVTAHRAKGLEFPHVIIADGGWRAQEDTAAMEEERRVFYVAATRARETLTVMVRKDRNTPFAIEMSNEATVDRTPRLLLDEKDTVAGRRQYGTIDPTELFIGYAGRLANDSPSHDAIRATSAGDKVTVVKCGKWIHIETTDGTPIGWLSEAGRRVWEPRLSSLHGAKVIAMVQRTATQEAEEYRAALRIDAWEFPLVEVCWEASGHDG